jgi:DNA mismatch repair protein MutL
MNPPIIRILPDVLANQIAAGEVVERPANALKELAENALDAGATTLHIAWQGAGLTELTVQDNGHGIPKAQLALALTRHATSKVRTTEDLFRINTFGFRGEALPSLAAVAKLTLTSRPADQDTAWAHQSDGTLRPAALPPGTKVTVQDMFYATPARRKFLKSARAETGALEQVVIALALARPDVQLHVWADDTEVWHLPPGQQDFLSALHPRLHLVHAGLASSGVLVQGQRAGPDGLIQWQGVISPPTLHTNTQRGQWLFVNGRPVRDRALAATLRQAYTDQLPAGRHPYAVLFLTIPADAVDVNVHPAKSEVRLRDTAGIASLLFGAVRQALGPLQAATHGQLGGGFAPLRLPAAPPTPHFAIPLPLQKQYKGDAPAFEASFGAPINSLAAQAPLAHSTTPSEPEDYPLGVPLGQIGNTYIVAETTGGALVVVDQHAAHERLVYEQLKAQVQQGRVPSQPLLLPALLSLRPHQAEVLLGHAAELAKFGLELDPAPTAGATTPGAIHGATPGATPGGVLVAAVPLLLADCNPQALVQDVLAQILDAPDTHNPRSTVQAKIEQVLASMACHHSIRAHRRLSLAEQAALLRAMEATPASQTCNHGRPTVRVISHAELEKWFDRR